MFSFARLKDIVNLNWRQRDFHARVKGRQRLNAVVQVTNPLFWTHAGWLDEPGKLIRSTGAAGYLLMGQAPRSARNYHVRWNGSGEQRQAADLGFVQVCYRDCRVLLAQNQIVPAEGAALAEIAFQVPREIRDVEFRMYVNSGSGINLSSVSIAQQ